MSTEIRIIVNDGLHQAMAKISKIQKSPNRLHMESIFFETVELHRPKQLTVDPAVETITLDSPIGMLPLETRTIKVLREAHKCIESGKGKNRTSHIARQKEMDIATVGELLAKTETDLLGYYEIGPKRIAEIKQALQKCNTDFELAGTQNRLPLT